MARDVAIVLNSGGLKSAVVSALAAQKYRLVLMHFEVAPEPTAGRRLFYEQQVQHFKPYREFTIPVPWAATLQQNQPPEGMGNRNAGPQLLELGSYLGIAARFADQLGAAAIYTGTSVGADTELLGRMTEFIQIWNELIQQPAGQTEIEIASPLMELDKWQAIDLGLQINAPFEKAWTCDRNGQQPCWECLSCRAREAAFQQTGKPDPLGKRK